MPIPPAPPIAPIVAGVRTRPPDAPRFSSSPPRTPSGPAQPPDAPPDAAPPVSDSRSPLAAPELPPDPTASLCLLVARGDPDALSRLYADAFPFLFSRARLLSRRPPLDESLALDLVHDAVLRLVRSTRALRRVASRSDLERWLTVLLRSCAADRARSMLRELARQRRLAEHTSRAPAPAPADTDAQDEFDRAWSMLLAADPAAARALAARFTRSSPASALALDPDTPSASPSSLHARIRRALAHVRSAITEKHP